MKSAKKIENRVIVLLSLLTILVLISAFMTYISLSGIVSSIHQKSVPDRSIEQTKQLVTYINQSENNIMLYTLTGKDFYMEPYDSVKIKIQKKFESIHYFNDTLKNTLVKDTLRLLLNSKLNVWDSMLYVSSQFDNGDVFQRIYQRFDGLDNADFSNKNFIQRLLGPNSEQQLDPNEIKVAIVDVERQAIINNQNLFFKQFELIQLNKTLTEQMTMLVNDLETRKDRMLQDEIVQADNRANDTYLWLAVFCILAVLLVLLTIFFIVRYVQQSNRYQVALKKAKVNSDQLSNMKETFITSVSNELKTPVNEINNLSDQLLHQTVESSIRDKIYLMKKSSEYLMKQVNHVMDFTRLRTGEIILKKQKFSFEKVVENSCALYKDAANQKNLTFECQVEKSFIPHCLGDPGRLRQIISLLLDNAIKFTDKGFVKFMAWAERHGEDRLLIYMMVEDSGIGMDNHEIARIYHDFGINSSKPKSYEGAGVGLAIVRQLIDLHGGHLEVESKKNQGTIFTCTIPYQMA